MSFEHIKSKSEDFKWANQENIPPPNSSASIGSDPKVKTLKKAISKDVSSNGAIKKAVNHTRSIEDLRSLDLFEGTSNEDLMLIQKAAKQTMPLALSRWIKAGNWTMVVNALDLDNVHYSLLAAYALGKIDSSELATAFIFIDCALDARENGVNWSIKSLDPQNDEKTIERFGLDSETLEKIPPNLRFEIVLGYEPIPSIIYQDLRVDYSFNENRENHFPSFGVMQGALDYKFGDNSQQLVPILGLSLRDGMIERIGKSQSDYALTFPHKRDMVHGYFLEGNQFYLHDLVHADMRSNFPRQVWIAITPFVKNVEPKTSEFAPYEKPLVKEINPPWIAADASVEDQAHWLIETVNGLIMEGAPSTAICYELLMNQNPLRKEDYVELIKTALRVELQMVFENYGNESLLSPQNISEEAIEHATSILSR